jgi:hypothetical protein
MVNFEVPHRSAALAAPAISTQHLQPEQFIRIPIKPKPIATLTHAAASPKPTRNAFFLRFRKKSEVSCHGEEQCFWIPMVQVRSGQKVRAYHLSRQWPLDLSDPSIRAAVSIVCSIGI